MARHRSHSIDFKRQVAQEYLSGETLYGPAKRHDISRNLIRIWIQKFCTAWGFPQWGCVGNAVPSEGSSCPTCSLQASRLARIGYGPWSANHHG